MRTFSPTLKRRDFLAWTAGIGLSHIPILGCGDDRNLSRDTGNAEMTEAGECDPIPEETAGPFPGNGTNGPNVFKEAEVVRSDIRSSFGTARGAATGVPLNLELTLVGANAGCTPLVGYAVYLWHCDQVGRYSIYSPGVEEENYLRGVQTSGADGTVRFTTIFPGCYPGRWPHMHFEVFRSLDALPTPSSIATSQLAFPADACNDAYRRTGYETSAMNLVGLSAENDGVFRDSLASQLVDIESGGAGYRATLRVPVLG